MSERATVFEFASYTFEPDKKRILFNYKTEFKDKKPRFFTETILLPSVPDMKGIPKEVIKKLLESLHLILGISYYKFYCATNVKAPYALSTSEANFWNVVYQKGLGEFFYRNKLDPRMAPTFPFSKKKKTVSYFLKKSGRCLVGIGGGKDSIVVAELLKKGKVAITGFSVQTHKPSILVNRVQKALGIKGLTIERFLDPQVFEKHLYNGHVPISAIYAFLGVLSAVLYGYDYIIVGNEHSSNFGNLTYRGMEINHQWSKSYEFEKLFQNYVKNVITPDVVYFSLLRRWYELRIVKLFSHYPKYFSLFSSCNRNFAANQKLEGLWCGHCPKCVFVFALLSAFLSKKALVSIFKKNLYEDKSLLPLFKDIMGFSTMKPFDCIGTFEEAQTAIHMAKKNFGQDFIVRQLGGKTTYHPEVFLAHHQSSIPEEFTPLAAEKILIAGFGKEGTVTKQYLKKYYPKATIGIADAKEGRDYLKKQREFDIAIKTPGIPKKFITIPYTTATNIFFSKVLGSYTVIGVTGSKGKSTTSTLIYQILKTAGKEVVFLGNIGTPMLQALLKPIKKGTIFVVELSSYQLDDIRFSPDIAVVTSLFPEHMDYHGGLQNYYQAKKNIINFQRNKDFFIYNHTTKSWLKGYRGKATPFVKKRYKTLLLGNHNQENIGAAAAVAKLLGISETVIRRTVEHFKPLPHRLEPVGTFKGITFYDDANAATPEATIMAIEALKKIDTIFLGGQDRGYRFSQLEKVIKRYNIKNVVLFPESGNRMFKKSAGLKILRTKSMEKAVEFAYANTKRGFMCLLSCASPSYSLWKNFEEKGSEFQTMVKKLGKS